MAGRGLGSAGAGADCVDVLAKEVGAEDWRSHPEPGGGFGARGVPAE